MTQLRKTVMDLQADSKTSTDGTHPLRLYFASVGGMVGLGNIVAVITAIIIGGPGALFWLWIASFSGMLIKYSEIYLGVKYRVKNKSGGYDGGPMYYLKEAFGSPLIPVIVSVLLCIYGVEVYQFVIITDTLSSTFSLNRHLIIALLILAIIYSGLGGIKRLANICTVMMPAFMITYVIMCLYVIGLNIHELPDVLATVFHGAFNGHAPIGGFVGSSMIMVAQQGIARAVYSGDIGIGYDSTIQSETRTQRPERQARMAVFSVLTDSLICTMSMLVVLVTGLWKIATPMQASEYVATALGMHFPGIPYFMAAFFFLAGYTTLIAFFAVGLKCANFLYPRFGKALYYLYAILSFVFFSFFDQSKVILIMSLSGGLLMLFNVAGIFKLRHKIKFK
jgi:AGCS family alanine or glycine:cation symporter